MDDFKEQMDQHRHQIYTTSFYYLGSGEDAEEVTQEVLFRWWKNREKIETRGLRTWLEHFNFAYIRLNDEKSFDFVRE